MKCRTKTTTKSGGVSRDYNGGKIRTTEYGTFQADIRVGGSRKRKQFETLNEAKTFIDEAVGEGVRIGTAVFSKLTPKQAQDAVEAFELLKRAERSESLYRIVQAHLDREKGPGSDVTVGDLFQNHIADLKARRRKRTWVDKDNRLRGFIEIFGGQKLSGISFQDVSDWLESTGHSGRTLRNDQIAIQSFFNWCDKQTERKARETGNPALHWHNDIAVFPASDWETSDPAEIVTLSNSVAQSVLRRLEERDTPSALVLAVGLLAGLRTSEICDKDGLRWQDIDLEEKEITVTAKQSKTKHGRTVAINPTLMTWLLKYKGETGRIGRRWNAFRKHRQKACEDVGLVWPQNAARHTFASNFCKLHGERAAADALGHTGSVEVLLDHYRGVMQPKSKAKAYFEILTPAGVEKSVIRMSA